MREAQSTGVERLRTGLPVGFCSLHMPRSQGARVQADRGMGTARTAGEAIPAEPFLHENQQSVPAVIDRLYTYY